MSQEDRVMRRILEIRSRITSLQLQVCDGLSTSQLVGELESIKNVATRALLEPPSDEEARMVVHPLPAQASRLKLVTGDQGNEETS